MDWLPTFVAAAGNPNITEESLKGKTIPGISADAAKRELQPRRNQGRDGKTDGRGGSGGERTQQLRQTTITEGGSQGLPSKTAYRSRRLSRL
jgi:hypothetical protein